MTFFTFLNEAHFNVYDMIIFMIMSQAIIFSVLLLVRSDRHVSHFSLAAFISAIGLGQFVFFLLYHPIAAGVLHHFLNEFGFCLLTIVFYVQGLLLHSYIRTLTHGKFRLFAKDAAPLVLLLMVSISSCLLWELEFFQLITQLFWKPFVLVSVIGFCVSLFYGLKTLAFIYRYWGRLQDRFSTLEHLGVGWLLVFTSAFMFIWVLQILPPFFYGWSPWWLQQLITHSTGLLSLVMINFVFFKGLMNARRVKWIRDNEETVTLEVTKEPVDLSQIKIRVDEQIRSERLYARPHLNIERMAQLLELPTRQLSFLINHEFQQNYFEFINQYRLAAAKERLASAEWASTSVQEIYESVGFASRSSFFTLFKKREGITPAEYRSKHCVQNPPE